MNRYSGLLSREPETNAQTFDDSGAYAGAFSQSNQVRFNPPLRDVSPSVSALNTGLSRITSTPIFRRIFSSYGFPVRTADQQPPPGQSDGLANDSCSSSGALMPLETPPMAAGGPFDIDQWGALDTNLLAVFTPGTEASPNL